MLHPLKQLSFFILLIISAFSASAQIFYFPPVHTQSPCAQNPGDNYTLYTGVRVIGVQLTNIYYDDGTNGSFGFEMVLKYGNIFEGTVASSGNFYTYKATLFTSSPNVSGPIANNGSNVALQTDTSGLVTLNNNPSYNGSASALGLTTGILYTGQDTINIFGFDSATLQINAPCLSDTILSGGSENTYPLPVLLSGFEAIVSGQSIELSWHTFVEVNNAGFLIEKSYDGKNWTKMGFVPSQASNGNSKHPLKYESEDVLPLAGDNFYRLIQTGINGEQKISGIAKVTFRHNKKTAIQLYPNPAADIITFTGLNDPEAVYTILNITGQIIQKGKLNNGKLHVGTFQNGIYFIRTNGHTQKIAVLH